MYEKGKGVKQDFDEAEKWYRLAADQGFEEAQLYLRRMNVEGKGAK
jgi:TPR repeat protein